MIKRIAIFLAFIILVVLAIYAYRNNSNLSSTDSQVQTARAIKVAVGEAVVSPINAYDNSAIWYGSTNGRLFRYDSNGGITEYPIPPLVTGVANEIVWPRTGNDFIMVSQDETGVTKRFYNSTSKNYSLLANNIRNFDWMSDGRRIALVWVGGDKKVSLVVSNADGSGYKVISSLPWEDVSIKASPTNLTALVVKKYANAPVNKIYLFNLENGSYQEIVSSGENAEVKWLEDGSGFLYSSYDESSKLKIFMFDFTSKQSTDLNLNSSLEKVWLKVDKTGLIAAIPDSSGGEKFVELDFAGLNQKDYVKSSEPMQVRQIVMLGQKLYFVNSKDNKLYIVE